MAGSGRSRADENRAIRQAALREQLVNGGHIQHVIDTAEKLRDLDGVKLEALEVQRLKVSSDLSMKLVDKYLASLKAIEYGGDNSTGEIIIKWGSND